MPINIFNKIEFSSFGVNTSQKNGAFGYAQVTGIFLWITERKSGWKDSGMEGVKKMCHVLKKVYTFYINTKIRLQFKYNPKIDLQSPFFCNNFSIYNLPF